MTAPRRRCACGKAALPGDPFCNECAVAIGERPDEARRPS